MRAKDLTNKRFGLLVARQRVGRNNGVAVWKCDCDCGATREARSDYLHDGRILYCDWKIHDPKRTGHLAARLRLGL